jgi:hypothetical protein
VSELPEKDISNMGSSVGSILCNKLPWFVSGLHVFCTNFNSYMETEKFEEAVRDYEKVCKMNGCRGALIYF